MSTVNDGGAAFPRSGFTPSGSTPDQLDHTAAAQAGFANTKQDGMTLRDYFAAAALQGILANQLTNEEVTWEQCACHAYKMADAMLAESAKGARR